MFESRFQGVLMIPVCGVRKGLPLGLRPSDQKPAILSSFGQSIVVFDDALQPQSGRIGERPEVVKNVWRIVTYCIFREKALSNGLRDGNFTAEVPEWP